MKHAVERKDIEETEPLIRPHIRRTPVTGVPGADFGLGDCALQVKLELMQHSGSFKCRGAFTNLLTRDVPAAGVVAASGGNHGAAVAFAARKLGQAARIYVPKISSDAKIARIRQYGADLVVGGDRYSDALEASQAWQRETGALAIHAFDQIETIRGQGTVGLEFENDAPGLDSVLIAVGGGGLIAGVAAWFQNRVRVVGVEPETAPTMTAALEAGGPADAPAEGYAADSLGPQQIGQLVYPIARDLVDRVHLVSDEAIRDAQITLWDVLRVVVEPGGAAAFAALTSGVYRPEPGERVGVLLSGGNTVAVDFKM